MLLRSWRSTNWHSDPDCSKLTQALSIIFQIQTSRFFTVPEITNVLFGYHCGQSAGQNIRHGHWHIIGSDWQESENCPWCKWPQKSDLKIYESDSLVAVLDGVRAGETVILSKEHGWDWMNHPDEIAEALFKITLLFKERFRNPDFIILSSIPRNGHFWVSYIPILNQWGGQEYLAMRGMGAYSLPCSYQSMLHFLKTGER